MLWAKLSKSVSASQVLDLGPNSVEPEFQHFTMSWAAGGPHFRLGLCKGQLQPRSAGFTVFLFGSHGGPQCFPPLRFLLLRLHGLALEAPGHPSMTLAEIVPGRGPRHAFPSVVGWLLLN